MRRVTVAEIMRESGLSRATVDRALNGRARVHPRTRAIVEETLRRLSAAEEPEKDAGPPIDVVLRLGRGMMAQLRASWERFGFAGTFREMFQAEEIAMLAELRPLCQDVTRPLIVAAKNTDRIASLLEEARARGKRVVAFVSDLSPGSRDVFVGVDNRAAGQTAAFLIGRALGDRPTRIGAVLGDPAFRCHEDREIGFRTALRANYPKIVLAGEALGEDNPTLTREAVRKLVAEQPALSAIYNVGAGNQGLIEALKEAGRAADMLVIGHEANASTTPLLREGSLDFALAQNPADLLREALAQVKAAPNRQRKDSVLVDFAVYTRFNIPNFAHPSALPL